MEIAQTEGTISWGSSEKALTTNWSYLVFAPIMLVMPYDTIEEAVHIANGTRYGLGASVFGPNQHDCLVVARQLECGMVSLNDFGVL